ncbi:MAG: hypothetical protein AAGC68_09015 [Verrucomicrobiota bacterium]
MKTQPEHSEMLPEERFVDAVLSESAERRAEYGDLVREILTATVERPALSPRSAPARSPRIALPTLGLAAAVLTLLAILLSNLPFGNRDRSQTEVYLVLEYPDYLSEDRSSVETRSALERPLVEARRHEGGIEFSLQSPSFGQAVPSFETNADSLFSTAPTSFEPSVTRLRDGNRREEYLQISSDDVAEEDGRIVYSGNVSFLYNKMRVKTDRLVLQVPASSSPRQILVAEGIKLEPTGKGGSPIAHATAALLQLDPLAGELILREVEELSTWENGDLLVLADQAVGISSHGFRIFLPENLDTESVKYANPLPLEKR